MKMKIAVVIVLAVFGCYVVAERCSNVTECVGTTCTSTADHVHMECTERHCTCSVDVTPCLSVGDCTGNRKCIDKDGHTTVFHCLDSMCKCIRV